MNKGVIDDLDVASTGDNTQVDIAVPRGGYRSRPMSKMTPARRKIIGGGTLVQQNLLVASNKSEIRLGRKSMDNVSSLVNNWVTKQRNGTSRQAPQAQESSSLG